MRAATNKYKTNTTIRLFKTNFMSFTYSKSSIPFTIQNLLYLTQKLSTMIIVSCSSPVVKVYIKYLGVCRFS